MKKSELYRRALKMWGVNAQIDMMVEECGELIVAISQWKRNRVVEGKIAEEIADVEIMCDQLRHWLALGDEEVNAWKEIKLTRLEERIKQKGGQYGK